MTATRVVERMQHSATTSAFAQWVRFSGRQRLLHRAVARLTRSVLARAFQAWLAAVDAWRSERAQTEHEAVHEAALTSLRADVQSQMETASESEQAMEQAHADTMACFSAVLWV